MKLCWLISWRIIPGRMFQWLIVPWWSLDHPLKQDRVVLDPFHSWPAFLWLIYIIIKISISGYPNYFLTWIILQVLTHIFCFQWVSAPKKNNTYLDLLSWWFLFTDFDEVNPPWNSPAFKCPNMFEFTFSIRKSKQPIERSIGCQSLPNGRSKVKWS